MQSNNIPNHCFKTPGTVDPTIVNEWTVAFNTDVTGVTNYSDSDFDSSEKTDEKLCDIRRTDKSNMLESSDYKILGNSENLTSITAIGLYGGNIFNVLDIENRDAVENEAQGLDTCSSHPKNGGYHYHFWSACLIKNYSLWSDSTIPDLCKDDN